jgi:hypothetical protein
MSDIKITVPAVDKIADDSTEAVAVEPKKINYSALNDTELMNMMVERGLEIPLDNGKLVRMPAIRGLKAYEEAARPLSSYRRMRVIFHRSGKEAEAPYVFMSLNGYATQAPYEKEVSIPEPVIRGCIDNAVMTEYEMKDFDTASGTTKYEERVIRTVPYTFLGYEEPTTK